MVVNRKINKKNLNLYIYYVTEWTRKNKKKKEES